MSSTNASDLAATNSLRDDDQPLLRVGAQQRARVQVVPGEGALLKAHLPVMRFQCSERSSLTL